jgi:hypothetical protein
MKTMGLMSAYESENQRLTEREAIEVGVPYFGGHPHYSESVEQVPGKVLYSSLRPAES